MRYLFEAFEIELRQIDELGEMRKSTIRNSEVQEQVQACEGGKLGDLLKTLIDDAETFLEISVAFLKIELGDAKMGESSESSAGNFSASSEVEIGDLGALAEKRDPGAGDAASDDKDIEALRREAVECDGAVESCQWGRHGLVATDCHSTAARTPLRAGNGSEEIRMRPNFD